MLASIEVTADELADMLCVRIRERKYPIVHAREYGQLHPGQRICYTEAASRRDFSIEFEQGHDEAAKPNPRSIPRLRFAILGIDRYATR